jgi:hypothetical protein
VFDFRFVSRWLRGGGKRRNPKQVLLTVSYGGNANFQPGISASLDFPATRESAVFREFESSSFIHILASSINSRLDFLAEF